MDQPDGIPGGRGVARSIEPASEQVLGGGRCSVAGVAAAFLAVALYSALTQGPPPLTTKDVQANIDQALASMTPPPAFSQVVYDQVRPSIVLIQVTGARRRARALRLDRAQRPKADPSAAPSAPPSPAADPSAGATPSALRRPELRTRHVSGSRARAAASAAESSSASAVTS